MKISRGLATLKGRRIMKMICSNPKCGYKGKAKRKPRGSVLVGLFLCLLMLLPGLLYFAFKGGYRYFCPKCGQQVFADV